MKQTIKENIAKASARNLPISTKQSIEMSNHLRYKKLEKAQKILERVIKKEEAIPFKRFTGDVGHKRGKIASGRYPQKAAKEMLKLLNAAEANAQFKGLSTADLRIIELITNKASTPWRYGRQTRRKAKRTNIDLVVESKEKETKKLPKKKVEEKKND